MTPTNGMIATLTERARWVRQTVLEMAVASKSGHVTTAFSQAEMLCALYYGGLLNVRPADPRWDGRDRFILSKGQGGLGLYPILADLGFFSKEELTDFAGVGRILGVHAEWNVPGIETISGSLGHGLPIASGMATALRDAGNKALVVVMCGDAELYEGSNWEALLYIAHAKLDNIVTIIDRNGLGTIGRTEGPERCDGPGLDPLSDKMQAFGMDVRACDGHDYKSIFAALGGSEDLPHMRKGSSKPLCIISRTTKGHGAASMADKRLWHYRFPTGDDLAVARRDLGLPAAGGLPTCE